MHNVAVGLGWGLVLAVATAGEPGPAPSAEAFFRPAAAVGAELPADRLYPRGRRLAFSLFSVRGVQGDWSTPGFTAIGPYYGPQSGHAQYAPHESVADAARALGVACYYRVGLDIPFLKEHTLPPDAEITAAIAAQVRAVVDRPEIAVWYVTPEELRHWRQDEMHYLEVATAAVRANDPQGRPVMLYEPNHRDAAALGRTLPYLDICSKGEYANATGFKDKRAWVRWGIEQELKAVAAVKPAATPYAVLWMAGDPTPEEVPLIRSWARHDVYLSLVTGAKGILVWSGFRRGNFSTFDDYLRGYGSAATELNGPLGLGQVFLFGERRQDVRVAVAAGPATQAIEYGGATTTYPTVSHADLAMGPERYLVLVNSANQAVTVTVGGLPAVACQRADVLAGGEPVPTAGGTVADLALGPYEVKVFRFSRPAR